MVNKFHKLCVKHNNERLYGNEFGKVYNTPIRKSSPLKRSKKSFETVSLDEELYELIFNTHPHECEECGISLPSDFRDDKGKVLARWQYSHILPKSTYPELRHNPLNMNRLCLNHHEKWENGDKKSMSIWKGNVEACILMGENLKDNR